MSSHCDKFVYDFIVAAVISLLMNSCSRCDKFVDDFIVAAVISLLMTSL